MSTWYLDSELSVVAYVTVLAKIRIVCTKTEINFIATVADTLDIYPSPVYQVLSVNWSTFVKDILPTLQSHGWNNGTHGGCQFHSGDLHLLPLVVWLTGVLLATVGHHGCSWSVLMGGFSHPTPPTPLCPSPPRLTAHPTHPL